MPRPKKVAPVEIVDEIVSSAQVLADEVVDEVAPKEQLTEEKPPEQILIPFYIKALKTKDEEDEEDDDQGDISNEMSMTVGEAPQEEAEEVSITKFAVYLNGEFVETVDDESSELINYLDLNRAELDSRIHELWQNPSDPNDLIFFNFGEQKMSYISYYAYFNQNGFAPVEPKIKSWMEYYLNKHNPITEEEIAIQLKGPLQYSFIPIKS
jgi:hypothetical protein